MPAVSNALITVNNVELPQPSSYSWSIQDVSSSNAGRTEDALMHKDTVAKKRKLQITWKTKDTETTSRILSAVSTTEYFDVRYFDMLDNGYETRSFYVGDRQADIKLWWVGRHLIETITFDLIER